MSSSGQFRWSVALLLALSITWKIASPRPENIDDPHEGLVKFFERNHFNVVVTEQNNMPVIEATTASCRLQITRLAPDGSNGNLIRSLVTGTDRLFVVFRGRVYAEQPISRTALSNLWSSFLRELGLKTHIEPVIAVSANSTCDAERLPWYELSAISGLMADA